MPNKPLDTSLVDRAIIFAVKAHAGTERRGKGFPYIIHPMEAMEIVATMTTDQELLAAAALHDTVEDTSVTIEQIRSEFGERVASLVQSETDAPVACADERATWRQRKQAALDTLEKASLDAKIVAMGDKLSNMRIMARDYREIGDALWDRFHAPGGKKDHAWRYRSIAAAFSPLAGTEAYSEFITLVEEIFGVGEPEPIELSDFEEAGGGFTATSYNSKDGRSMMKLYREFIPQKNSVIEMKANWSLLKMGIKTPPAIRLISCGKSFGVEFGRVHKKRSFARAISEEPERLEYFAREYAKEFKRLSNTPCDTAYFKNIADIFAAKVKACKCLEDTKKQEYLDFIDSLPVETTCIHGDNHVGNILVTDEGKTYWIDTADFAWGYHMFDVGMMYFNAYIIRDEMCYDLYHFPQSQMVKVWEVFVKEYFGPDADLEAVNKECAKFAAFYIIKFGANGMPVEPQMVEFINNLKLK